MRLKLQEQFSFVFQTVAHRRADVLERMDKRLSDAGVELLAEVHADLVRGLISPDVGRNGLSAETTLRALIIMRMFQLSYDGLEFHLRDSVTGRQFCRIDSAGPSSSALHRAIKAIRPSTLESMHRLLMRGAQADDIETGETVSVDATAVTAKIRAPTDSGLLCDVIRTGTRLLRKASRYVDISFSDHNRLAKRRHLAAHHARRKIHRVPHYRRLLWAAKRVVGWVRTALELLPHEQQVARLRTELGELADVGDIVLSQARRRVIRGESVPSTEKVVSLHEPHVDIIIKDNRNTFFGHKVFATRGLSGLVVDVMVVRGNPSDVATAVESVRRIESTFGQVPTEVAMDGGFASGANLTKLKSMGVKNVAFAKRRGLAVEDMVSDKGAYRRLRNFRSMIEATFSWLKGSFGLDSCNWSGFESFASYVWSAVITHNLVVMARAGPA